MADGKWIDDLSGGMPMSTAARLVLTVRLGVVDERLPAALHQADEDREHVHQLRVGTRRAAAALRIFEECLPGRPRKAIKKALKRIRRAAGGARDWDVFEEMIAERMPRATTAQKPAYDFLLGYGQGQRALAQQQLDDLREDDFRAVREETLAAFGDSVIGDSLSSQAPSRLTALLRELDTAAAQDLQDYDRLHQVRIVGKQLRYAMEVFACCFESAFRDKIYPVVEEMQDILGLANDSFVAVRRLNDIRARVEMTQPKEFSRYRAGLETLTRSHQRRLAEQRRVFLKWWQTWQSSGLEKRLDAMLRK